MFSKATFEPKDSLIAKVLSCKFVELTKASPAD
jgi:hypothetical protein